MKAARNEMIIENRKRKKIMAISAQWREMKININIENGSENSEGKT
jgi:hypothetical protein